MKIKLNIDQKWIFNKKLCCYKKGEIIEIDNNNGLLIVNNGYGEEVKEVKEEKKEKKEKEEKEVKEVKEEKERKTK